MCIQRVCKYCTKPLLCCNLFFYAYWDFTFNALIKFICFLIQRNKKLCQIMFLFSWWKHFMDQSLPRKPKYISYRMFSSSSINASDVLVYVFHLPLHCVFLGCFPRACRHSLIKLFLVDNAIMRSFKNRLTFEENPRFDGS